MKEKIKISMIVIVFLLILTLAMFAVIKSMKKEPEVSYKNLTMSFEGDVVCFKEDFYFNKSRYMMGLTVEPQSDYIDNSKVEVWIDDIEIQMIGEAGLGNIHFRKSDKGIYMTGGGCLIDGLDKLLQEKTGINVMIAQDTVSCVALGTGKALDTLDSLDEKARR